MTKYIALDGVMAAFFVGKLFVSLVIVIWVSIKNKHFAFSISDYLLLPDDFGIPSKDQFNHIITSPKDAVNTSKGAIDFFEKHNFDKKELCYLSFVWKNLPLFSLNMVLMIKNNTILI